MEFDTGEGTSSGSVDVERKTTTSDKKTETVNTVTQVIISGENVLHKYRSFTYLFTLACLTTDERNHPESYHTGELKSVIFRSGGKGLDAIKPQGLSEEEKRKYEALKADLSKSVGQAGVDRLNEEVKSQSERKNLLVGTFNAESPGRFDMFIDNVEIETLMTRDGNSASTQPTKISFDVFEPYSINGFIEAIQVGAQACGHPGYNKAPFVLKIEFVGYPDDDDMPDPITETYGTRFFPLTFTGIEVAVDERGTKYKVSAVPVNEVAYGNPSKLKKAVKVKGITVKEILEDLCKSLSEQVKKENEDTKEKSSGFDEYRVKFPSWNQGKWTDEIDNQIAASKVTEITEDKNLFHMPDPGKQTAGRYHQPAKAQTTEQGPRTVPNQPSNPVVQFHEDRSIPECIEAIVRDSHYLRDDLKKLMGKNWKDAVKDDIMFNYFLIRLEVTEKPEIDKLKNTHYYIYTYVVTPFKMLYTKVPGFGNHTVDQAKLYKECIRRYDYLYTGKNLDIVNFKLNFNSLFFEAIPLAMGNPEGQPGRDATSKTDGTVAKKKEDNNQSTDKGLVTTGVQASASQTNKMAGSGGQTQQNPYYAMSQSIHDALINAKASMISGEIEILGDPIYVVTSGMGNNNPKSDKETPRVSKEGEAQFTYGDVYININFKNPIDIGDDGFYHFDGKLLPFSGVYQVTRCVSKFKDGAFKQTLDIIRQPGQALIEKESDNTSQNAKTPVTDPSKTQIEQPNPDDVAPEDSAPLRFEVVGTRPDEISLNSQFGRTYPNPGLPGEANNFTAAIGGAGNTIPVVSGLNPNLPGLTRTISPLGISPQPAFGIPMPAKAAAGLQQQVYSPGGLVQQLGKQLLQSFGVKGPVAQLANQLLADVGRKVNSVPVLGSGIGVGASINIAKNIANPQTAYDYQTQQLPSAPTAIPTIAGLSGNALANLANNPLAIAGIANGTNYKTRSAIQGTAVDPTAVTSVFGINQSQISGLSSNLTSKVVNQLNSIVNSVPADTDLNTTIKNGVNLNNLGTNEIASLPATAPFARAPDAELDQPYLKKLAATQGLSAVAKSFGINSVDNLLQSRLPADLAKTVYDQSPAVSQNSFNRPGFVVSNNNANSAVLGGKLLSNRQSLAGFSGAASSVEGNVIGVQNQLGPVNVGTEVKNSAPEVFGSVSSGASPLDKIMIR